MTIYANLLNLLAGFSGLLDRLTTIGRRSTGGAGSTARLISSQSPPRRNGRLWAYRLRISNFRAETLSAHLRRDIGLDN